MSSVESSKPTRSSDPSSDVALPTPPGDREIAAPTKPSDPACPTCGCLVDTHNDPEDVPASWSDEEAADLPAAEVEASYAPARYRAGSDLGLPPEVLEVAQPDGSMKVVAASGTPVDILLEEDMQIARLYVGGLADGRWFLCADTFGDQPGCRVFPSLRTLATYCWDGWREDYALLSVLARFELLRLDLRAADRVVAQAGA